jgi:hypothetical protein
MIGAFPEVNITLLIPSCSIATAQTDRTVNIVVMIRGYKSDYGISID